MRFLIIVKATAETEAGRMPAPSLVAEMQAYHEALHQAGIPHVLGGLKPSAHGWRIRYSDGARIITDGPFVEAKELIAGFTLIEVKSRDEALTWARRFPNPMGPGRDAEIEVRELYEPEELGPSATLDASGLRERSGTA